MKHLPMMTAIPIANFHCCWLPYKTRMQSLAPSPEAAYRSIREGLTKMVSSEGLLRPMGGVNAVIIGAGPAHAFYFSTYEGIKATFGSNNAFQNHIVNAGAGCGATLLHDAIMVPADVIKQRMQMYNSPYSSCFDCLRKLYRSEGVKAFYRSFTTQLVMNLPFHAIHIVTYEKFQSVMNPERDYNPRAHMVAGAAAGAAASAFTTPLDMCKTVLNTQETSALVHLQQSRVVGLLGALRTIYVMNGVAGFFKGIQARVLYQMPGTAISWSIYELFKHHMTKNNRNENPPPHWDSDLIKDSVIRDNLCDAESSKSSSDNDGKLMVQERRITLGTTTNKTVERLRTLHMPSLTANCSAADDNWLGK
ncbi:mitoferrin-1-like isoform X2 [Homarus americanus]|uniref:mitoferrin-1-like isoform X2 n=1 Tax=Homarus americanus TaxID=6706 RepID=UPI001C47428E|nr:mitoferrin-1-like isoform X2 [Homarus americanus]